MSKSLWIKCGVAAIAAGVVVALVMRRGPHPLQTGDRLPAFTLQQVDAVGPLSIRGQGHEVVLVNFWATWCPPCVEEAPSLEKFAREMAPRGVRVIGVSVDRNGADLLKFVAQHHLTYPILRDPDQSLAARFGTYKFPETYIFDRDGRLADKIIGPTDWSDPRMIQFVGALTHWNTAAPQQAAAATGAY
ncbi:MAG: TlpA family protein disulfide reductase [Terriglobia bacterium]